MNVYPEDFEPTYRVQIQQARDRAGQSVYGCFSGIIGFLIAECWGMWLLFVSPRHVPYFFVDAAAGVSLSYVCGFFVDRKRRTKKRNKKVTAEEIDMVSKAETDPLKIEYLGLTSDVVLMRPVQDTSMEESFRAAIRDIGSGVEKLPEQPAGDLLLDAWTFEEEAFRLTEEAAQESDSIVAASLQRQSAAQNQCAEVIARNSALARRNQMLRREMTGHIKALKTMIGASAMRNSNDYDLTALAKNIQQVAIEATSLTEAKKELAIALEEGQDGRKNVMLNNLNSTG